MDRSYHAKPTASNGIAPPPGLFDLRSPGVLPALPVPVHAGARHTERRAAERVGRIVAPLRTRTLQWVKDRGDEGLTAMEGGGIYATSRGRHPLDGSSRWSIAPRLTELAQHGYVRDSGKVRDGCIAWVWTGLEGDASEIKRTKPAKEPGCQSNH